MKKSIQTHMMAVGGGIILGAAFKGLIILGLVLLVAGGSVYAYLKYQQAKSEGKI